MSLQFLALLPHPSDSQAAPDFGKSYPKTKAGLQNVRELLTQTAPQTLVIISQRPITPTHAYSTTQSEPNAIQALGLDQIQVTDQLVLSNDSELIGQVKSRIRTFGMSLQINPLVRVDPSISNALGALSIAGLASFKLAVFIVPYEKPNALFEFGKVLGAVLEHLPQKNAIIAVGNLSSRSGTPAKQFDTLVANAAHASDYTSVINADPADLEAAGEEAARLIAVLAGAAGKRRSKLLAYESVAGTSHTVITWQ